MENLLETAVAPRRYFASAFSNFDRGMEIQIYNKPHAFLFKIQVETEKDDIPTEHNTFIEFDVRAYNSPSRTFLYVRAIRVGFMKFLTSFYLERFQDVPQRLPYPYFQNFDVQGYL